MSSHLDGIFNRAALRRRADGAIHTAESFRGLVRDAEESARCSTSEVDRVAARAMAVIARRHVDHYVAVAAAYDRAGRGLEP